MTPIDEDLVRALVAAQLPAWRDLPVRAVRPQGWDNRTFRLGDELVVRLPSAAGYAAAVAREDRALRQLGTALPVAVPSPVTLGVPGCGYPFPWSVRRWLPGTRLDAAEDVDRLALARDLAAVLVALRAVPATDGPPAGIASFLRGCHPGVLDDDVTGALRELGGTVDADRCRAVWAAATRSAWPHPPVWFHGDVAVGNLLVQRGRLSALIDFGTCGVGDPACDLVPAWTVLRDGERAVFRAAAGLDDDTWDRARGWALWKALVTLAGSSSPDPDQARVLDVVLADRAG